MSNSKAPPSATGDLVIYLEWERKWSLRGKWSQYSKRSQAELVQVETCSFRVKRVPLSPLPASTQGLWLSSGLSCLPSTLQQSLPFPSVMPRARPSEVERRPKSKLLGSLSFPTGQWYYPFMALLWTVTFTTSRHRKATVFFTNGPKLPAATHLFSHTPNPVFLPQRSRVSQSTWLWHSGSSVLRKATADQTPVRGKVRVSGH